jgi:hypothetical protein
MRWDSDTLHGMHASNCMIYVRSKQTTVVHLSLLLYVRPDRPRGVASCSITESRWVSKPLAIAGGNTTTAPHWLAVLARSPEPQYIWPAERSCSRSILTCNFQIRTAAVTETPQRFYPFHLRFIS